MSDIDSLRDTITPKSDQLNADDLLAGPITVRIESVKRGDSEQPISIGLEGLRPFKPCKSMRRVLITAWGDDGREWVGREMTLYNDPEVKWGGVKVGGIRISHMSGLDADLSMSLTATRGKRTPYLVKRLTVAMYDPETFDQKLEAMNAAIANGKMTKDQVIAHAEKSGKLTDQQKARLIVPAPTTEQDEEM